MTSIEQQIISFSVTVSLGMIMGFVFDMYYCLRKIIKPSKIVIHLVDILIWMFLTALVFFVLLLTNWADVRFYVFIGIGMGLIIYYTLFSKIIKKCLNSLILFLFKTIKMVISILTLPFKTIGKAFLHVHRLLVKTFKRFTKPIIQPIKAKTKKMLKYFLKNTKYFRKN